MCRRIICPIVLTVCAFTLASRSASAQARDSRQAPTWLWVVDEETELGIAGAWVDTGPGRACLGRTDAGAVNWSAHFKMGPAGRILTYGLPDQFSCRVTLNGKVLKVVSIGRGSRKWTGPRWLHLKNAPQTTIEVRTSDKEEEPVELDYWSTTNDPTRFMAYIQDLDTGQLIPDVKVKALRSGLAATSDSNGLFTLNVPASYRKGKTPPVALETLVFSKPGYNGYEYRDLVLNPGIVPLTIYLEKGTGTVVRRNRSVSNGGIPDVEFVPAKETRQKARGSSRGEITSIYIAPSVVEGGWIMCTQSGAKAVVKGRNLKSVSIYWYSTGTGIGEMPPAHLGPMKKVSTSPQGDTWEIELPDLMTTDFWAEGTDVNGNTVKSMNLGNVSWHIKR